MHALRKRPRIPSAIGWIRGRTIPAACAPPAAKNALRKRCARFPLQMLNAMRCILKR